VASGRDARNNTRHFFDRAGRRVHVGAPQLGDQQIAAAEHIKRQIAVAIVIAVEEAPFLLAVQGSSVASRLRMIRSGVRSCASQEQIDEQAPDRNRVVAGLVIAGRFKLAQFQPVERRLAGDQRTIRAPCLKLPARGFPAHKAA
jgi:hypothetical protein